MTQMKASLLNEANGVRFVVMDVPLQFRQAITDLGFAESDAQYAREFDPGSREIRPIFSRFGAALEPMLRQAARLEPAPWDEALSRFAEAAGGADWWVVGSGALAVRGMGVAPRDLDIGVAETDFDSVVERLDDYLVEPPSHSESWVARWFCRAFIGMRVEWVAGVQSWVDSPEPADFGPVAEGRRETVIWRGHPVHVPPLDLQLAVSRRRGLVDRAKLIEKAMAAI